MVVKDYEIYLKKRDQIIHKLEGFFGCILEFHGFVRKYDLINGEKVSSSGLNIDSKILEKLQDIEKEAKEKFDIIEVLIYHNTGKLKIGEKITSISIWAEYRKEAFLALNFIIDEIKKYH